MLIFGTKEFFLLKANLHFDANKAKYMNESAWTCMKSFKVIFFLKLQLKNEKTISIHLSDFDGLQCWGYEGFNWD